MKQHSLQLDATHIGQTLAQFSGDVHPDLGRCPSLATKFESQIGGQVLGPRLPN